MSTEVTTEVVLDDRESRSPGRLTVLRLVWEEHDPLAVQLVVIAKPDHPALPRGQWVVLRETLRAGLFSPSGVGDVHIEPNDAMTELTLTGELRRYVIQVPRHRLEDFLDYTDTVVPMGTEVCEESLDAELERLLNDDPES